MWIEHFIKINNKYIKSNKYDIKNDLHFAMLFMKLISKKIQFLIIKDYKNAITNKLKGTLSPYPDPPPINPDNYYYLINNYRSLYKNFIDECSFGYLYDKKVVNNGKTGFYSGGLHTSRFWAGHITFYGLDDYDDVNKSKNWQGPSPVKLRFYIQDTLRNEINEELKILKENGDNMIDDAEHVSKLLDDIRDHTNSEDKITQLLNSIKDILCEGFLQVGYWKDQV